MGIIYYLEPYWNALCFKFSKDKLKIGDIIVFCEMEDGIITRPTKLKYKVIGKDSKNYKIEKVADGFYTIFEKKIIEALYFEENYLKENHPELMI